ncbi:MAG: hypothetical protein M0R48_10820 [Candidatus Omnitrophica bacterium]|nr:hypothetical protein [Candidatus Omnitrophota bacterium]
MKETMNEIHRRESKHKDCRFYEHFSMVTRTCCGGKHIKEIYEVIRCDGIKKDCSCCESCYRFKKKDTNQ